MPDIQFTPEEIQTMMEQAKERIIEGIVHDLSQSLDWKVKNTLGEMVAAEVKKYMEAEIVPAIQPALAVNKQAIMQTFLDVQTEVSKKFVEGIYANLAKKMTGWNWDSAMRELFK